jgi:hypothetical protein
VVLDNSESICVLFSAPNFVNFNAFEAGFGLCLAEKWSKTLFHYPTPLIINPGLRWIYASCHTLSNNCTAYFSTDSTLLVHPPTGRCSLDGWVPNSLKFKILSKTGLNID